MSRWIAIKSDPVNLTITLAHDCRGAHSPYTERHTDEFLRDTYRRDGFLDSPAGGAKPTHPCGLCRAMGRDHDPHLPCSADVARDLARYGLRPQLLADEMYERWKQEA